MDTWIRELLTRPWVQKLLGLRNLVIEEDSTLDLTWSSLPPAWVIFLLIIPGVVIGFSLIYRNERRDAGTVPKFFMGACRVLIVLLVIVMLFGPTITIEAFKIEKSYVLVLIDDSQSMAKLDRPRLESDQLRIAQAVMAHPPAVLSSMEVDQIRSMSRLEIVQEALRNPRMNFVGALQERMNVAFYSFSGKIKPRDYEDIALLTAGGAETAIGEAINQAMAEKRGSHVIGMVVFTDGRSNSGQDPEAVAEHLADRGKSVYMVGPGVARKPMDLRLKDLEAPEAAVANDHVRIKYRVHAEGYNGETIKVRIYIHALMTGQEPAPTYAEAMRRTEAVTPLDDKVLTLEGDEARLDEEFVITPDEPGLYELIIITDTVDGESTEENNYLVQRFLVADEKITVLYVDHWPRWEYRFLKNALIRDTMIKAYILLTSADETFPQDHSPDVEGLREFPKTLKELLMFDVVIIGDVPLGKIGGPATAEMLATFAGEFGGGIVFLSGTDSNPQGYRETPLARVLPVVIQDPGVGGMRLVETYERDLPYRLTREGEIDEITRLEESSKEDNIKLWNNGDDQPGLPQVRYYVPVKRVKTAARVLVHLLDPAKPDEKVPLFVTMFYGQGRIFFSATDETYRWRWLRGDQPYFYPFWQHVMYWARKGKLLGLHRFRVSVDRDTYSVGEMVNIYLKAYNQDMEPLNPQEHPTVEVYVEPPSGDRQVLALTADDSDQDGFYSDTFTPREIGEYRVWAGESTDLARDVARFSVIIPNREEENPIIDEKKLMAVARNSHISDNELPRIGTENFYQINELDVLAKNIKGHDFRLKETREDDLWDAPLIYLLFALLITAEWIMRKIFRML